jgi:EAP30/Vps36 family
VFASVITATAAKLKVLGSGFGLVDVGRTTMVVSVPRELSGDAAAVLQVAEHIFRHTDKIHIVPGLCIQHVIHSSVSHCIVNTKTASVAAG